MIGDIDHHSSFRHLRGQPRHQPGQRRSDVGGGQQGDGATTRPEVDEGAGRRSGVLTASLADFVKSEELRAPRR